MATIRCEKCGSLHVNVDTKIDSSYSVKKGLVGRLLFGLGGSAMGVGGKKREIKSFHCQKCGWQSSKSMDDMECWNIEMALKYDRVEELYKYKSKYINLEWEDYIVPKGTSVITEEMLDERFGLFKKKQITKVVIPDGVVSIEESAFSYWISLKEVKISKTVTKIGRKAFSICKELEKIVIPNGVKEIGKDAFAGCRKLKEVSLPNSILSIEERAFSCCDMLEYVEIPQNIETIKCSAFGTELKSVEIPKNVKVLGERAFNSSSNLTRVCFNGDKICEIGEMAFANCPNLTNIIFTQLTTWEDEDGTVLDLTDSSKNAQVIPTRSWKRKVN